MAELNEKQLQAKIEGLATQISTEKDKGTKANQGQITAWQNQVAPLKVQLKGQRSRRLATMRVNNAIKKISLIENLAAGNYSYTDEQKDSIVEALSDAVVSVDNAFKTKKVLSDAFCI